MSWFLISLVEILFVIAIRCQTNIQSDVLQCNGPMVTNNPFIKIIITTTPYGWIANLVLSDIPFEVYKISFGFAEPVELFVIEDNSIFGLHNDGGSLPYIYHNSYSDSCSIYVQSKYTTLTPHLITVAVNEGINICHFLLVIPKLPVTYRQNLGNIQNTDYFKTNSQSSSAVKTPQYVDRWGFANVNSPIIRSFSYSYNSGTGTGTGHSYDSLTGIGAVYSSSQSKIYNDDVTNNSFVPGITSERNNNFGNKNIVFSDPVPKLVVKPSHGLNHNLITERHTTKELVSNTLTDGPTTQRAVSNQSEVIYNNPAIDISVEPSNSRFLYTTLRPAGSRSKVMEQNLVADKSAEPSNNRPFDTTYSFLPEIINNNPATDRSPENISYNSRYLDPLDVLSTMHINSSNNVSTQNISSQNMAPTSTIDYREIENDKPLIEEKVMKDPSIASTLDLSSCGRRTQNYMANAYSARQGDWPWHAAIYYRTRSGEKYKCGGSLVHRNVILTAAHCIYKENSQLQNNRLIVRLGLHNKLNMNSNVQEFNIQQTIVHENFNNTNFKNDIALLRLTGIPIFNDFVQPVCLWLKNKEIESIRSSEGKEGYALGFGYNEQQKGVNELAEARMPVVSHEDCLDRHSDIFNKYLSSTTFCARFQNGTSVCNGDSGGGMFFEDDNNIFRIRGIVSSNMITNDRHCNPNDVVIFTNVAKYLDWIESAGHSMEKRFH